MRSIIFFFSSRRRHTRLQGDWSSDVCSSDLNAAFAEVCRACSITFIGPSPEAIRLMGDKAQARQLAKQAGVPVVPGSELPLKDAAEAADIAEEIEIGRASCRERV